MIYCFLGGLVVGFLVSFFMIKRQIAKDGAGQLKCCHSCPYFKAPVLSGSDSEV